MNAARQAIREIATQIISGQVPPLVGARLIAGQAAELDAPGELAKFDELARDGDEAAILEHAGLLVADTA